MDYRLGLDLGTNSIGWSVLSINKASKNKFSLLGLGVRIFSDGREPTKGGRVGDSLAVARCLGRGARRNRDHGKNRMAYMMQHLIKFGLMPQDKDKRQQLEVLDPYTLRVAALERPLRRYELGRVLFHLGSRRGFKSNRKDTTKEKDESAMKDKISALKKRLDEEYETLGQFLHQRITNGQSVRFRDNTDFFPEREMYQEEFESIRKVQAKHHALKPVEWEQLRDHSILFQHPLKPVERGKCSLRPEFFRAHHDTPIAHWFRIYQDLSNLFVIDDQQQSHPLEKAQRDAIVEKLLKQTSVTFNKIRSLKCGKERLFPKECTFNLESDSRKKLDGHKIAFLMQKDVNLAPLWDKLTAMHLDDIFEELHSNGDDKELIQSLIENHALTEEQATAFADLKLSTGTQKLSRQVMEELLPLIRDERLFYSDAVKRLNIPDTINRPLSYDHLPYYGEVLAQSVMGGDSSIDKLQQPEKHFGRIPNPTVHVALNQLRRVVNSLIDRFGTKPSEIHVEVSRDLKFNAKKRNEINKNIAQNTKYNEKLKEKWKEIENSDKEPTTNDLNKLKLWEELGKEQIARCCVFSGKTIAAHHLFNGEVEVEHLLPFSRTLDDSMSNKTLVFRGANRAKGNRTPYEAFGNDRHSDFKWQDILDLAKTLPKSKRWRFASDAMTQKEDGFISRQLTDNAYIAQSARKYLEVICGKINHAPGRLTAMIRHRWGLNKGLHGGKDRTDHRHHAIDAFVVALADRKLLQDISTLMAKHEEGDSQEKNRAYLRIPSLCETLKRSFFELFENICISYKADHGTQGHYFKETAYGVLKKETQESHNLVTRKPITNLSTNEISDDIRDPYIRDKLHEYLVANVGDTWKAPANNKKLAEPLAKFGQQHGIRRLRILVKNQTRIKIKSASHKAYAPDGFVCCDVWAVPQGKPGKWEKGKETWKGVFWNYAQCANGIPDKNQHKPHPGARFKMRLFKDDMVTYREDNKDNMESLMRVAGFSTTNNRLDLRPHLEANAAQKYISINVLAGKGLAQVNISPDGRYRKRRR